MMSNGGFVKARMDYTAYGEDIGAGTGLRTNSQGFDSAINPRQQYGLTERDSATGLDHTWFRKNENRGGRWTSPDPYNGSISLGDPQSFNRYNYVNSQPTNFVDPSGLSWEYYEVYSGMACVLKEDGWHCVEYIDRYWYWSDVGITGGTVDEESGGRRSRR